jgi:ATP-binding cassette, subfamily B, bacterial MsbA
MRKTLWRHKMAMMLVLVFSILVPFLEVAFIGNLYWIIDPKEDVALLNWFQSIFISELGVVEERKTPIFVLAGVILVSAVLAKVVLRYLLAKLWYSVFVSSTLSLISDFVDAPHHESVFIEQQAVTNAAQRESENYATYFVNIIMMGALPISVGVFLVASYAISPLLALLVMGIGAAVIGLGWKRYQISYNIGVRGVSMRAALLGFVTDIINGITSIKTRAAEQHTKERSEEFITTTQRFRYETQINVLFVETITSTVILVSLLGAVGMTAFTTQISAASVLVFIVLMTRVQRLVQEFQGRLVKLRSSIPAVQKLESLRSQLRSTEELELEQAILFHSTPVTKVELTNVVFSYPDSPDQRVINNASLTLSAGDRVLIEGPSGEGKSTLLKIIAGLIKPTSGTLAFNDTPFDISEYRGLRERVAYVSGDMHLFSSSGRLNLDLANDLDEEEQQRLLDSVDLTKRLSDRLDDSIGSNGARLSLGQRQRLLLTHVFIKQFDLVLMDEAISNVDPKLQTVVLENLGKWVNDDAIVVNIAHHSAESMEHNRRLVFQSGKLTER